MTSPYDDIINHPHHVSRNHPQMSMHDRAAHFSPFAALTGYEDAIKETQRQTEQHRGLDEQELAELSQRLVFLNSRLSEHPEVSIEYFVADKVKSGGEYITCTGTVHSISMPARKILMNDGTIIPLDEVVALNGAIFDQMDSF